MSDDTSGQRFATRVIHGGQRPDPLTGAVMPPIYATSTYVQSSPGVHKGYRVLAHPQPDARCAAGRARQPRGRRRRLCLRLRHGGHLDACWSCSMPARTSSPCTTCTAAATGCWRTCASARPGTSVSFVDLTQTRRRCEAAMRPDTRLVWVETPTNPLLKLVDLSAVAALARAARHHQRLRQHLRHALHPAPARARLRHRRALDHQVPERALGRDRRRGDRARRRVRAAPSASATCRMRSAACPGRSTPS